MGNYRSYHRKFDGKAYWAKKPLCIICKEKKVKNGNICYECQEKAKWSNKYVPADANQELPDSNLIQNYQTPEVVREQAEKLTHSIIGYLKDCAITLLRSDTLTNITNTKDVEFMPLEDSLDFADGDFSIESKDKKAFEFLYIMLSRKTEFELLLGFMFIKGKVKSGKNKDKSVFAPLLYLKLDCAKSDDNTHVTFTMNDDTVVLNQALISHIVDIQDETELEVRFQDLYSFVPNWPLTLESLNQFLFNLKNSFPDLPIAFEEPFKQFTKLEDKEVSSKSLSLIPSAAIILTPKQEAEGTIVDELHSMANEILNKTGLDTLFSENFKVKEELPSVPVNNMKDAFEEPEDEDWLQPFDLSDQQKKIVIGARSNPLTVISGPPGTGKSYTISAIIADHLLRGKRVLFVSRMEKAVDIIVSRLEEYVGEFSVAKSGNRKAQMQLVHKLDKLTGPRSSIKQVSKTDLDQLKQFYLKQKESIEEFEDEFLDIVEYERDWANTKDKINELEKKIKGMNKDLKLEKAKGHTYLAKPIQLANKLRKWDKVFFMTWWGNTMLNQAKKLMGLPEDTTVNELIVLLEISKTDKNLSELGIEIDKFDEVNSVWLKIQKLRGELKDTALEYLRSVLMGNLYQITNNHPKRMDLKKFTQLLRSANIRQKLALREKINIETLLQAFPCWASTTTQLSQILPLSPGIFDLVIFDESSQCDLASAAPALYRGNRAVIVGDPKQLTHVVFMGKQAEMAAFVNNNVPPDAQASYRFTKTNLFDVAETRVQQAHYYMLDEHFRSDPRIIGFSNKKFYDGNLRLMTQRPVISNKSNAIEIDYVKGKRTEGTANPKEIEAIFKHVDEIIQQSDKDYPTTIGILCPFRDQVNAITKELPKHLTLDQIETHKIVVGTAHSLQGDEKDVVVLSLSIDPKQQYMHMTLRFLETPNVFNVAITRAKKKLVVISSVEISDLPNGLLKDFLLHAESSQDKTLAIDNYDSGFEQDVAKTLVTGGFSVWPQYESAGFKIDLVVGNGSNFIAVECDGPTHYDLDERNNYKDIWRQQILERAGWVFVRIPYREWDKNPKSSLNRISDAFAILTT